LANMETVVITGAAGGMGSAAAALFRSKGYQVLGTDSQEIAGVDFQVVGDVADEVTWEKISAVIEQNDLEVVSLINIAGRNYFDLVDDAISDGDWYKTFGAISPQSQGGQYCKYEFNFCPDWHQWLLGICGNQRCGRLVDQGFSP
jgi:NAD(P)-dependent dehydrogenase (short-subunit alcohol dehydrogenase family)